MLLEEFGFCPKFLACSTARCIEVKGFCCCKNPAGLCHVLGVEAFYQLELQKMSSSLDPRKELMALILKKCTCKPLVGQYREESSTAESGTDTPGIWFIRCGDLSKLELPFAECLVVYTWLEGITRRNNHWALITLLSWHITFFPGEWLYPHDIELCCGSSLPWIAQNCA